MNDEQDTMPLFSRSLEIKDLVDRITFPIVEEGNSAMKMLKGMQEDASLLTKEVAKADTCQYYDLKMESAVRIKRLALDIQACCTWFHIQKLMFPNDLDLITDAIEDFRVHYAEWVKTFHSGDYTIDRWGLFNPPGVNYDDEETVEELPLEDTSEVRDL